AKRRRSSSSRDGVLRAIPTRARTASQNPTDRSVADLPGKNRSKRTKYLSSSPCSPSPGGRHRPHHHAVHPPLHALQLRRPQNNVSSSMGHVLATHSMPQLEKPLPRRSRLAILRMTDRFNPIKFLVNFITLPALTAVMSPAAPTIGFPFSLSPISP